MEMRNIGKKIGQFGLSSSLIFLGLIMLIPIYLLIMTSFRTESTIFSTSLITSNPTTESLVLALTPGFIRSIANSLFISLFVTIVAMVLHALCGYALATMNFLGKKVVFNIIISTLMIPVTAILVPLFMVCKVLGITNSYAGIILPSLFNAYGIFLFRQFYLGFPRELEEAAEIEGCSKFRTFFSIVFPLSKPIIVPLAIAFFLGNWNNYLWPLVVNKRAEFQPIMVYLANMVGGYNTKWNIVIATTLLACLPVFLIFLVLQRQLQDSIKMSGIKQ